MLALGVLPILIAVGLLVWAGGKLVHAVRSRQIVRLRDCLVVGIALTVCASCLCLLMTIIAGLGHSTRAGAQSQVACLLAFVTIVGCPVAGLLLYRHYQTIILNRDETVVITGAQPDLRNFKIAAGATIVSLVIIIVLSLGRYSLWPPLMFALRNDHEGMANLLMNAGFVSNASDICGNTPLPYAAMAQKTTMLKRLVDKGANVNSADGRHMTALGWAIINGNTQLAEYLVEKGADVNPSPENNRTPLMRAAERGNPELTAFLLEKGAKVNTRSAQGTALAAAARFNHTQVVRMLIDNGADTEIKSASDWTPLMVACGEGYVEVVKLLLERGANPLARSYSQETPLTIAVQRGHSQVAEMIKAHSSLPQTR